MKDCNECKYKKKSEDEKQQTEMSVPYIVHEAAMARAERHSKRLWIALIVAIAIAAASNLAWIIYENQFEDVVITQDNTDGYNNFIGDGGDIYNGETND